MTTSTQPLDIAPIIVSWIPIYVMAFHALRSDAMAVAVFAVVWCFWKQSRSLTPAASIGAGDAVFPSGIGSAIPAVGLVSRSQVTTLDGPLLLAVGPSNESGAMKPLSKCFFSDVRKERQPDCLHRTASIVHGFDSGQRLGWEKRRFRVWHKAILAWNL